MVLIKICSREICWKRWQLGQAFAQQIHCLFKLSIASLLFRTFPFSLRSKLCGQGLQLANISRGKTLGIDSLDHG